MDTGIEQKWPAVSPRLFTSNGSSLGIVTIASTNGFKVKQRVVISATSLPDLTVQVKRVISETQLIVGPITQEQGKQTLTTRADLSAYTTALGAFIYAEEQTKVRLKPDDITQALYDQEPTVAMRSVLVDQLGRYYDSVLGSDGKRRLAVDAAVSVSGISVDLDAVTPPTRPDPDNVLTAGSEDGTKTGTKRAFVNNQRLQILSSHDRSQAITYADFGTKNQRITQIDYTSPTFPGITARKIVSYTLVGNNYRRDSITWSIV